MGDIEVWRGSGVPASGAMEVEENVEEDAFLFESEEHPVLWDESILKSLGVEVTAVLVPVTACMVVTVWLVRTLFLTHYGFLGTMTVSFATAVYEEQSSDSLEKKVLGGLLNSLAFIVAVTVATYVLYLCMYYNCNKIIYGYMGFSGFSILFFVGGFIIQMLLNTYELHFDAISFVFILYNLSAVGAMSLFLLDMPMVLKQGYLVVISVIVALMFTRIPAWTTWFLLAGLVFYDLGAVLLPGGPLRKLVELALERNEALPALVYTARFRRPVPAAPTAQAAQPGVNASANEVAVEIRNVVAPEASCQGQQGEGESEMRGSANGSLPSDGSTPQSASTTTGAGTPGPEASPGSPRGAGQTENDGRPVLSEQRGGEQGELRLPDAIKLGLGDFIFYSVLVGRASLYDMTTVYVCYFAIVAGLGATLFLLALFQKALPALPISITLGLVYYIGTRYLLDSMVTPISVSLLYV